MCRNISQSYPLGYLLSRYKYVIGKYIASGFPEPWQFFIPYVLNLIFDFKLQYLYDFYK